MTGSCPSSRCRCARNRWPLPLILLIIIGFRANASVSVPPPHFDGNAAFAATAKVTAFGERPPGSEPLKRLRMWILTQVKPLGCQVALDSFDASTPAGRISMTNIILKFPGNSGQAIAITGHYDTALKPMLHFVGADDGGSSTGFLVELARALAHWHHPDDIYIVFFDGEEALREWTATDSLYGSRHLAAKWGTEGVLSHLKALLNIDMIGDKDLDINNESNSSQSLRDLMRQAAAELNDSRYFEQRPGPVEDDHLPFIQEGVNAIDIIDLDYQYWHTGQDTMDKLSLHSFQVVGDVVVNMLERLEKPAPQ